MLSRVTRRLSKTSFQRSFSAIHDKFEQVLPEKREQLLRIKKQYSETVIGEVKIGSVIGGMRGLNAMVYDTSDLDAHNGITFKGGWTIPEICAKAPKAPGGEEPLPEAVFWLLLTGEFPTEEETKDFQADLRARSTIPQDTVDMINNIPADTHPMTQLSMAILSLQRNSKFADAYRNGERKEDYWRTYLDDSLDLIAKLPIIAAQVFNHTYRDDAPTVPNDDLDWAGNYAHMMGFEGHEIKECIRGYLAIHSDHEGGNVSAHANHLVSSALSDPYLSYSAAVNGLAGPLHGLANQEVLRFLMDMRDQLGEEPTDEQIVKYAEDTLASGKVIPGYGHAVLRNTDPRYLHQKQFAQRYIKDDPLVDLTAQCFSVIPEFLNSLGKVANPYPNVDAHSGVLLHHYGMTQFDYYTAVFAVSRALGCTAAAVWSRALGLPIERPGSLTLDYLECKGSQRC